MKKAICIYGASSAEIAPVYVDAAREAGRLIALAGRPLVSGGGRSGLMAAAIDGALEAGGEAIGVLPEFMVEREWQHPGLTQMIVTPDMHSRKRTMAELSSAAIALPGGCGTLEELLEIITWRQLGLFGGNVVIASIGSYYAPLLEMLDRTIGMRFMNPDHRNLWRVADNAADAVEAALAEPVAGGFSQKKGLG